MLIFWDTDIWPMSCATRCGIGAVEVTQGHELLAARWATAPVPAGWAAAAGTIISPASAAAAIVVITRRLWCPARLSKTSAPVISLPPMSAAPQFRRFQIDSLRGHADRQGLAGITGRMQGSSRRHWYFGSPPGPLPVPGGL